MASWGGILQVSLQEATAHGEDLNLEMEIRTQTLAPTQDNLKFTSLTRSFVSRKGHV